MMQAAKRGLLFDHAADRLARKEEQLARLHGDGGPDMRAAAEHVWPAQEMPACPQGQGQLASEGRYVISGMTPLRMSQIPSCRSPCAKRCAPAGKLTGAASACNRLRFRVRQPLQKARSFG
jgi:hypothetical protein